MRIVNRDAVEHLAAREHAVPHLFEPGHAAATEVVDERMAVEHLKQPRALQLQQLVSGDCPAEVGMVHAGHGTGAADRIDHPLRHVEHRAAAGRLDERVWRKPIDVHRLVLESIGDLFALHDKELFVGAVQRVEAVDAREVVVVGERDEVVAMLAIPPHHIVRRGVAVAIERVRVEVASIPEGLRACLSTGALAKVEGLRAWACEKRPGQHRGNTQSDSRVSNCLHWTTALMRESFHITVTSVPLSV